MTANRVHERKVRRYAEDGTEQNRIVRTGKYEAEVTNNIAKNCARGILLLKRSRGPLATAELLRLQIYQCVQFDSVLLSSA